MESLHVYVSPAFAHFRDKPQLDVLEIGFGTGLNALLTMLEAEKTNNGQSHVVRYRSLSVYFSCKHVTQSLPQPP